MLSKALIRTKNEDYSFSLFLFPVNTLVKFMYMIKQDYSLHEEIFDLSFTIFHYYSMVLSHLTINILDLLENSSRCAIVMKWKFIFLLNVFLKIFMESLEEASTFHQPSCSKIEKNIQNYTYHILKNHEIRLTLLLPV